MLFETAVILCLLAAIFSGGKVPTYSSSRMLSLGNTIRVGEADVLEPNRICVCAPTHDEDPVHDNFALF